VYETQPDYASELIKTAKRIVFMTALPAILRYADDSEPGIARIKRGKGFSYKGPDGKTLTCKTALERINLLGLPPAYSDVWICEDPYGHLQATGRDVKGRKQYRYHEKWREFQERKKFENLPEFGEHLSYLRRKISRDLRRQDNSKDYVCAAITRLIDKGALRVGHEVNDAIGASTLKTRHITLSGSSLQLDYKAKGGKRVRKQIKDKTLARVLHSIDDLPGRRVFQYIGQSGQLHPIDSSNVNAYIGEDFSAKTFRTWHGTLAAFETAQAIEGEPTLKIMSEAAAQRLHNTPAICRSSYIHPRVIGLAENNIAATVKACDTPGLRKSERQLLEFIRV